MLAQGHIIFRKKRFCEKVVFYARIFVHVTFEVA